MSDPNKAQSLLHKTLDWYARSITDVKTHFGVDENTGLTPDVIAEREKTFGKNEFTAEQGITLIEKIKKQFASPLVIILLVAGVLTIVLQEFLDTIVIVLALLVNVAIGVFQEERASSAFEKLNSSQEKFATVIRSGARQVIPSRELVPGDIVIIESGMSVPADMRLVASRSLSVNEAALTGEWVEVVKDAQDDLSEKKQVPLAEQVTMVWMGTLVTAGYGMGVVVETGHKTQVGKIAESLTVMKERQTPIQSNIRRIAQFLIAIVIAAIVLIVGLGIFRGEAFTEIILVAIAIAVAVVPEGLPAAVTVVLALGMERILRKGGLVKSLVAAETLGGTTTILTDKTGTLTEGRMKIDALYSHACIKDQKCQEGDNHELLQAAISASDGFIQEDHEHEGQFKVEGRPIERAILNQGIAEGIIEPQSFRAQSRLDFLAFESRRPFAASLNTVSEKTSRVYFSGSPEYLMRHASSYHSNGKSLGMTDTIREHFTVIQEKESRLGKRFIGVAYKEVRWESIPDAHTEEGLAEIVEDIVFLGFIAFTDSVRTDVKDAILTAKLAGARVIMVTGDNPETARSIAREVGIIDETYSAPVLRGSDIAEVSDEELSKLLAQVRVFARVLPEQKLRISRILKNDGEVVAMTGDGINDAPALRSADIGIAVGSGTEVAKESADLILLDNSFSIIVYAIAEGRRILDNLKKIIAYMLTTSFGEMYLVIGALLIAGPLPILPTQILWTNIVGGGLMSFAFAFESADNEVMQRSPREHSAKNIMTPMLKKMILITTLIKGTVLICLYMWLLSIGEPIEKLRTVMFVGVTLDSFLFIFALKNFYRPLWRINFLDNKFLLVSLGLSTILLAATFVFAPLRTLLSVELLGGLEIAIVAFIAVANLVIIETGKYIFFKNERKRMDLVKQYVD